MGWLPIPSVLVIRSMSSNSKAAIQSREWRARHPGHGAAYMAARRKADPEEMNAQIRKHTKAKRDWLQDIKLERGCADCGYNEHACVLQFDHVRGEKKFTLARVSSHGWDDIKAEAAKCDVVCANCHAKRTFIVRNQHGALEHPVSV